MRDFRSSTMLRCSIFALSACTLPVGLHAQDNSEADGRAPDSASVAPSPDTGAGEASDIVVTGSRIVRSGMNAPTPVTVLSATELLASSPSTVAAALNNLPAMVGTATPNSNGGSTSAGRSTLNLRGLGSTRSLILLDGRRFPATGTDNTVDTNLIPQGLIQRVDVVTGGASAAYGSDAVAGVVNFVLDTDFDGIKAEASLGLSERGDGFEKHVGLTFGRGFASDRGRIILNGEFYDSDGIEGDARAFRRRGDNILPNPDASNPPTAANPSFIAAPSVRTVATHGGLITSATGSTAANNAQIVGLQFLPGGVMAPYDYGALTTSSNQSGGDGVNTAILQPILRPLKRYGAFGRLSYDVTDNVTWFAEGSYGFSKGLAPTEYYHTGAQALTISADNAYLPDALRTQMNDLGITSFKLARYDSEPNSVLETEDKAYRAQTGFNGRVGALNWQAFYQYGRVESKVLNYGMYRRSLYTLAVDAVVNGSGDIVCRSTLTNPDNGCVPLNPFGEGAPSDASLAYVNDGVNDNYTTVVDQTAGASISGPLVEGWAGPISFATGIDYRNLHNKVLSNPGGAAGDYFTGSVAPWSGGYEIWEGFGELDIPLARNTPGLQSLDLNLAVRYADYSTSGGAWTWKAGLNWEPINDLRFRATRSRDIRAPNPNELFGAGVVRSYTINDPFRNGATTSGVPFTTAGNPNLTPEKADTTVLGVVYRPSWLPGFDISIDGYDIKIEDAIANLTPQEYLDRCFAGDTDLCGNITRNPAGVVNGGTVGPFNFQSVVTRGIDFEAGYRVPGDVFGGDLSFRGILGYIDTLKQSTDTATFERAGQLANSTPTPNSLPQWRGLLTANYLNGPWSSFLQMRYIGAGKLFNDYTAEDSNFNDVAAQAYFDFQIGYKVNSNTDVSLNVQNLLDKDPPFAPLTSNYNVPTIASLYDQIGRMYRLKVQISF